MNPNLGIFSAALHERLQPKQHILLEPEGAYGDRMREFQKKYKNSWYVPLDGYNWDTYSSLFSKDPLPPPWPDKFPRPDIRTTLSSEDVNTDLLFVGHMGKSTKSQRLVAQFISCCGLGSWIQRYGRVRLLLWVTNSIRDRYLPWSIAAKTRPAATAEAIIDITEVAASDEIRKGRGIPKLPVINQDNVHVRIKLNVRPKLVEDEIKKLVAEMLGLPKTRGRPKKLSHKQQKELEKTTAKVRKIVEAIRDRKKPKLPRSLPTEEQVRVRNRYDEIRRTFGHKTEAELAAEKLQKIEDRRRRQATFPKTPSRPRKLSQRGQPPTIEEIEAIEDKILKNPGLWIKGMEHPPWYYHGNKKELREFVIRIAAMHPVLLADPNQVLQPEDIYSVMIEAMEEGGEQPQEGATGEDPSTASASVNKEGDKSAARIWEEYEERWSPRRQVESQEQGREDEIYAARNNLLKVYNRPYDPLHVDPNGDFFPHVLRPSFLFTSLCWLTFV